MRRHLVWFLAASLLAFLILHIGYLYIEVGKGIAESDNKSPSIFYGRPWEIRKGDHLGNIRFIERLNKLSYKKVREKPSTAGTFSEDQAHIRIFLRKKGIGRALMETLEVWAEERGSKLVGLATRRAAPFYKALGYEDSAVFFRKLLGELKAG